MRGSARLLLALVVGCTLLVPAAPRAGALPGDATAVAIGIVPGGYVVGDAVGGVFTFGTAPFHGSLPERGVAAPTADLAVVDDGVGYLVLDEPGGVHAFGSAIFRDSLPGRGVEAVAEAISPVPGGYLVLDRVGGVHAFGAAAFLGSFPGRGVIAHAVDLAVVDGGAGYLVLDRVGGVHAFGTAAFLGSLPGRGVAAEAAAIASVPGGYLVLDRVGGVHAFGGAAFLGSLPGRGVVTEGTDIQSLDNGAGYFVLDRVGGVHAFGTATYMGSLPDLRAAFEPTRDPAISVATVVSGLTIPWDVGFAPDGTMIYTEKSGRLSAFVGGQRRLLAQPGDVYTSSESGMMGLAVDPSFATNRIVHVCQGFNSGGTKDVRVYRWQVAADWTSASRVGGPTVAGIHITTGRHAGCRLRFGPDGFLWIGTGDAATGTNPQDLTSLAGKVLRVDGNTGTAAPGNPFTAPNDPRIYNYGHRNIQGLAARPGTSQMYNAEHGTDRDDEVNLLYSGANYGWDPVPGYNETTRMTDFSKFPNAIGAVWSSGFPTTALSGITFLSGSQWMAWNGTLVGANLKGSHLRMWTLDFAGTQVVSQTTFLSDRGRLRSVTQGPDGSLYVTTSNGGGADVILRLTPS